MLRRYCIDPMIPLDVDAYGPDALLDLPEDVANTKRRENLGEERSRFGI